MLLANGTPARPSSMVGVCAVLTMQIERKPTGAGKAVNNFDRTLPPEQSDLAREVLKDPYIFDFLTCAVHCNAKLPLLK